MSRRLIANGVPAVDSVMAMQDFWSGKYFNYVEKKVSREQLFDLAVAKEAKARLEKEKPFGNRSYVIARSAKARRSNLCHQIMRARPRLLRFARNDANCLSYLGSPGNSFSALLRSIAARCASL